MIKMIIQMNVEVASDDEFMRCCSSKKKGIKLIRLLHKTN